MGRGRPIGFFVSGLLHLFVGAVLLVPWAAQAPSESATRGVAVELAMFIASGQSQAAALAQPRLDAEDALSEPQPEPEPVPEPEPEPEPEPAPEPERELEPAPEPAPEPEREPEPAPKPEPERESEPEPQQEPEPEPEPEPKPESPPRTDSSSDRGAAVASNAELAKLPTSISESGPNPADSGTAHSQFEKLAPYLINVRQQYLADVLDKLKRRRHYPRDSRRRREEGKVIVHFVIHRDGGISGLRIATESKFESLNGAALETVRKAVPFAPIPQSLNKQQWPVSIPIVFRLRG